DNSVIALTSTNAFSDRGNREVWMVKGFVIPELRVGRHPVAVDGAQQEALWTAPFPVFIGHKSATQLQSQLAYDNRYLYLLNKVKDASVVSDAPNREDNDGVGVQLDPGNRSYEKPGKGVFTFFLSADNKLIAREGSNGKWVSLKNAGGIKTSSRLTETGYVQELAIPWAVLGGKPAKAMRMGFNMSLTENAGGGGKDYKVNIPANNEEQPFTWLTVKL
ncbi:MAG: sugar-binding protein, partial [Adhaeribacter sp.]